MTWRTDDNANIVARYSEANTANPPTQANMVSAFGAASQAQGMLFYLNDAGGGAAEYLCGSDGTNWWYVAMTVGA